MGRLKAASLINNIQIARDLLGEARLGELLRPLPAATAELFARRLLAVEWVDADQWLAFQQAMLDQHYSGDEAKMRSYMHKVCERDFNTFYKIILKLSSPKTVLTRAPKIWATYAQPGELIVESWERSDGMQSAVVRLVGFETRFTVFAVLLQAFVEQISRMTGARDVLVERTRLDHKGGRLDVDLRLRFRE